MVRDTMYLKRKHISLKMRETATLPCLAFHVTLLRQNCDIMLPLCQESEQMAVLFLDLCQGAVQLL